MSAIGRRWLDGETVAVFHSDGSLVIETPYGDIEIDGEGVDILAAALRYRMSATLPPLMPPRPNAGAHLDWDRPVGYSHAASIIAAMSAHN